MKKEKIYHEEHREHEVVNEDILHDLCVLCNKLIWI